MKLLTETTYNSKHYENILQSNWNNKLKDTKLHNKNVFVETQFLTNTIKLQKHFIHFYNMNKTTIFSCELKIWLTPIAPL